MPAVAFISGGEEASLTVPPLICVPAFTQADVVLTRGGGGGRELSKSSDGCVADAVLQRLC